MSICVAEIPQADRGLIDMKHIRQYFWRPLSGPLGRLRGWGEGFHYLVTLHIKFEEMTHAFNMVANILPVYPPSPDPWGQVKSQISCFSEQGMLHIKLKGMRNAATFKYIFCPYTPPQPMWWGQRSKHLFYWK